MTAQERPYQPSLPWRLTSAVNIGIVGFLSRSFLYALNRTQTRGLERFLEILDGRKDERTRTRGLVTVSNHYRLDDPMMWGVLPNKYFWQPNNMRWSLGSYDVCFKNSFTRGFFSYGNTLPTHRAAYSKFGGLFQPTMTHAIRLLSDPHGKPGVNLLDEQPQTSSDTSISSAFPQSDPFSSSELTYTTTGTDRFPNPDVYPSRRHSWVHIFPEGMIHQHPDKVMRYFKWGVARLILEAEPCPDVVPIWIDGPQHVMDDRRPWPRPLPRPGRDISVNFGEPIDVEKVFGPFRARWKELVAQAKARREAHQQESATTSKKSLGIEVEPADEELPLSRPEKDQLGVLTDWDLKYGAEAQQLRIDVTMAVRNEVLKVRRSTGLKDEDPKRGLAETFRAEGGKERQGLKQDGSVVREE